MSRVPVLCPTCGVTIAYVAEARVMTARAFSGAIRKTLSEFVAEVTDMTALRCVGCENHNVTRGN
jgi:ribosomal protein S27E